MKLKHVVETAENGGFFLKCKFDQRRQNVPFQTIRAAVSNLAKDILRRGPDRSQQFQEALSKGGISDNEGRILVDMIPALDAFIFTNRPDNKTGLESSSSVHSPHRQHATGTSNRFISVVRKVLKAFVSNNKDMAIVWLLDDIQWIDSGSATLIESFIVEDELHEWIMFVGTYRTLVSSKCTLPQMLQRLERDRHFTIEHVHAPRLDEEEMFGLVKVFSKELPNTEKRALVSLLMKCTQGNVLFASELLGTIRSHGLLMCDNATDPWDEIKTVMEHESVASLLGDHIKTLDTASLEVLQTAALLGFLIEVDIVQRFTSHDVQVALLLAMSRRLVVEEGQSFHFASNVVQNCFSSSLSEEEKALKHLEIERSLRRDWRGNKLDESHINFSSWIT